MPSPTTDQSALANMLAQYNYFLNPQMRTSGITNHYSPGSPSTNILGQPNNTPRGRITNTNLDIASALIGIPFINRLFGNDAEPPQWQPFAQDGNYYWQDPTLANPVPLSNIPGAGMGPSPEYQNMANQVRAVQDLLPYYYQAVAAQQIPQAMGQLAADTATTGPRLALQEQLQRQYGPIFDQLAAESNLRRSMASASNDAAVLRGAGSDAVRAALEAARIYDPEYFNTRTTTADSLQKLLANTTNNLGKGLSNVEADEVNRGLALSNARSGSANAPSQLQTVSNAMQFGQAGRQREIESQNQLSKAIAASTAFLPASKSNVDVFQVATGRPSYPQNDTRFNTNTAGSDATSSANALLNTGTSMWTTNQNNALTRELAAPDWTDTLSAITGAIGSIGGIVGMAGMCWIAREVYGENNLRWLLFRAWLLNRAPKWLLNAYIKYGQSIATFISDKPMIKSLIRNWMNGRINSYARL